MGQRRHAVKLNNKNTFFIIYFNDGTAFLVRNYVCGGEGVDLRENEKESKSFSSAIDGDNEPTVARDRP
jgi:hypothetical protein